MHFHLVIVSVIILLIGNDAFQLMRPAAWKVAIQQLPCPGVITAPWPNTVLSAANDQKFMGCCETIQNDGNTADVKRDSTTAGACVAELPDDDMDGGVIHPLEDMRSRINTIGTRLGKSVRHVSRSSV